MILNESSYRSVERLFRISLLLFRRKESNAVNNAPFLSVLTQDFVSNVSTLNITVRRASYRGRSGNGNTVSRDCLREGVILIRRGSFGVVDELVSYSVSVYLRDWYGGVVLRGGETGGGSKSR